MGNAVQREVLEGKHGTRGVELRRILGHAAAAAARGGACRVPHVHFGSLTYRICACSTHRVEHRPQRATRHVLRENVETIPIVVGPGEHDHIGMAARAKGSNLREGMGHVGGGA